MRQLVTKPQTDTLRAGLVSELTADAWTFREVCEQLEVTPRTISHYIHDGMPSFKVRGRSYFNPPAVRAWYMARFTRRIT